MIHELPLERRTLHGHFSRDLEPVLTSTPGDSVRFATPNAGWWLDDESQFEPRSSPEDDGHALAGPIAVAVRAPGRRSWSTSTRSCPGPWGETFGDGTRMRLGARRRRSGRADGSPSAARAVPRRDGHAAGRARRAFDVPPRPQGGNIDCKELVAGTTLYLPIPVDGALFSAGDGHAAQGDGEVSGTAIECPSHAQLTLDLRDDLQLEWPCARIDGAWLTFGFDADLTAAAWKASDGMLALIEREHGLERSEALAFASVVVDLRVTQLVNGVLGVHAVLRDDALL